MCTISSQLVKIIPVRNPILEKFVTDKTSPENSPSITFHLRKKMSHQIQGQSQALKIHQLFKIVFRKFQLIQIQIIYD